jgi:superfamily II DNA/RNA helicase
VSVKGFYYCLENYAREVHRLVFRPSCVEFARNVSAYFDTCIYRHIAPDPIGEELLNYAYDLIVRVLKEYHICKDMDTFTSYLCEWSKGLPASQELCKYLRKRVSWELGKPALPALYALYVKLYKSPTLRKYDVKCYEVPVYGYARSSKRFSDTLSEITGSTVSSDVVKNVFGLGEDYSLFEHQISAINELRKPGSRVVIVATPNASGKTEIGLFTAMDIIRRGGGRLVLVVYPTKALARDQFDRWKRRLEGFCKVTLGCNIIGGDKFYLVTNMFRVVLLDGDTIRKLSRNRVLDNIVSGNNPLVVLTNPQFLLTILQESSWRRCFGRRCLAFLVLDEIHFYKARDLTLLTKILEPTVIGLHVCRSDSGNVELKVLILSATIGDPSKLKQELEGAWSIKDVVIVKSKIDDRNLIGSKHICTAKVKDDGVAESLIRDLVEELFKKANTIDEIDKTLIFVPNRNVADRLSRELQNLAWRKFKDLHVPLVNRHLGDMALWEREYVEANFKEGRTRILVTVKTLEVGIDIGDVARVINWGLPATLNDLVQREGRSGRRPGEYESIIIVRTSRDETLANEYLNLLETVNKQKDLNAVMRYTYTPLINPNALLIKILSLEIRSMMRHKPLISIPGLPIKLIPKDITVATLQPLDKINVKVSFYNQDKREFKVTREQGRTLRRVRIEDVIYRYLPGSIRPITKVFIVKNVNPDGREVAIEEFSRESALSIWGNHVTDVRFCLDDGMVKKGMIFTVSDVMTSFGVYSMGDSLEVIRVHRRPEGTKLIRKDYVDKTIKLDDGRVVNVRIPVFKLCGHLALSDDLKDKLKTEIVTRGIHIPTNINDIVEAMNAIRSKLVKYSKLVGPGEVEPIMVFSYLLIGDYIHYATHLLLNIASEVSGIRVDDLEHYIGVSVDGDDKLREFLKEFLYGESSKLELPIKVEVVVANEVDLIEKIKWHEVLNRISDLKSILNQAQLSVDKAKDIVSSLYVPRCFHEPTTSEDVLSEGPTEERLQTLLDELKVVIAMAEHLVDKIVQKMGGLKGP